jgi:hypothetical protein
MHVIAPVVSEEQSGQATQKKTHSLLKGHNSAKNYSSERVVYNMHKYLSYQSKWNCNSGIRGVVQTNFITHCSFKAITQSKIIQAENLCHMRKYLNNVKIHWNCISGIKGVVRTNFKNKNN